MKSENYLVVRQVAVQAESNEGKNCMVKHLVV